MLDINYIRRNHHKVQKASKQKGYEVDVEKLLLIDEKRRKYLSEVDEIRQKRNELAEAVKGQKPALRQIEEGKKLKADLSDIESALKEAEAEYLLLLKQIPNMPASDVPVGQSEDENQVVKTIGEKPKFDFEPKNHWQIAQKRGWIDKERAAKITGARFAYIKGDLALLWMALVNFGFSVLTNEEILKKIIKENDLKVSSKPFTPVLPPLMLKTGPYDAMDRLEPSDDRYKIEGEELWLQGSAEHVLGPMHMKEILSEKDLPIRYVGYATSFRREAGSYGKDMEGIFRMHQFDKLEMESLSAEESSLSEHYLMIAIQEYLMRQLELPYRVLNKCTFDIGKPNARGVDIEVWLPGQNKYRETHTADYMTDYQARRLQTRIRRENGEIELAHTNDATALAQRPLIAILENFQNKYGMVIIPEALRPYMGGRKKI